MKSRLQLIVVLLFIGTAGIIFMFSGKKAENALSLEVVEDVNEGSGYKSADKPSAPEPLVQKQNESKNQQENIENEKKPDENSKIFVHVCGAVKKEGVYQVEKDARAVDAIKAAGGLTEKAASAGINQAEQLKDGMQIYVPTKKEVSKGIYHSSVQNSPLKSSDTDKSQSDMVNINTATKEELMKLNGVGEAKASLIIAYRESNGGFKEISDLMKIKGIKQKFFDKIKDNICV